MSVLSNNSSVPLYAQLENILKEKIKSGKYPAGSRFPTEEELSKEYNVSRVTVRKALHPLTEKGILERTARKGTFVARKKLVRTLSNVMSFSELCRAQGYKPGAKTLRINLVSPTEDERTKLKLKVGEQLLLLERLRYADETPVVLERTSFSEEFFFLMNENLTNTSLYEILAKHQIHFTNSFKELDIVYADYKTAKYLNVQQGHPLLRIVSLVQTADSAHAHLSEQLCVADNFKIYV